MNLSDNLSTTENIQKKNLAPVLNSSKIGQQIKLFYHLKEHIDLLYKQIHLQNCALKQTDKFQRYMKIVFVQSNNNSDSDDSDDDRFDVIQLQNQYEIFDRNYCCLRKRCRRLFQKRQFSLDNSDSSSSSPSSSLYNYLYDLFESIISSDDCRAQQEYEEEEKEVSIGNSSSSRPNGEPEIFINENDIEIKLEQSTATSIATTKEDSQRLCKTFYSCPLKGCSMFYDNKAQLLTHLFLHSNDSQNNTETIQVKKRTNKSIKIRKNVKFSLKDGSKSKRKSIVIAKRKRPKEKLPTENIDVAVKKKKKKTDKLESLVCDFPGCSYVAKYPCMLKNHRLDHTGQRPYKCEQCGKGFKELGTLRGHYRVHSVERYRCQFEDCKANYAEERTLRKHIAMIHTKEAPKFSCSWPDCSYTNCRMDLLRKHYTVHTGERRFPCIWPACEKVFKTQSSQREHMLMHKNERRYQCSWPGCCYSCNLSGNLRKHEAIHEKKQANINNGRVGPDSQQQPELIEPSDQQQTNLSLNDPQES